MKKIIIWLVAATLVLSCCVTAFASETGLDDEVKQADIGVYAKYIDNTPWNTIREEEGGWRLVVDPISDSDDAFGWIKDVMSAKADQLAAYHIFLVHTSGETKPADGIPVGLLIPEKLSDPAVFSLTGDSTISSLSSSKGDGEISFTTDGSPFYILGKKSGGSTPSGPANTPQTGDNANPQLWVTLLILSIGGLTASLWGLRKKEE